MIYRKGLKRDDFNEGAAALMTATMNGSSCGGEAANATVNAAMETLKNCSWSILKACGGAYYWNGYIPDYPESDIHFNICPWVKDNNTFNWPSSCPSTCGTKFNDTKNAFEV